MIPDGYYLDSIASIKDELDNYFNRELPTHLKQRCYKGRKFNIKFNSEIEFVDDNYFLHAEDGPAVVRYYWGDNYWDGYNKHLYTKELWYHHGKLHRTDGPAVTYLDGGQVWYVDGKKVNCFSQEEFKQLMKLKSFW